MIQLHLSNRTKRFALCSASVFFLAAGGCASPSKLKPNESSKYAQGLRPLSLRSKKISLGECSSKLKKGNLSWREAISKANACVTAKQWDHVLDLGNYLAGLDLESPWGNYFQSLGYEQKNQMETSVWSIDLALKKNSEIGLLHYQKGRLLWKLEKWGLAVGELQVSLKKDPNLVDAHLILGQVFLRDENWPKAQQHFQSVLHVEPKNEVSLAGMVQVRLKTGETASALEHLKTLIKMYPDKINYRLQQASIYENEEKDLELALLAYREMDQLKKRRQLKGDLSINIQAKMAALEKSLSQTLLDRQPAQVKGATP